MAGDDHDEPRVVVNDDGIRVVSWPVKPTDGSIIFQHDFPDAVQHHYQPAGASMDVWLYQGEFYRSAGEMGFHGDIRWRWGPTPRIEVRGTRSTTSADILELFSTKDRGVWVQTPTIDIRLSGGVLPQQPAAPTDEVINKGRFFTDRLEQDLGDPVGLERVTFLIPNGWHGDGASGICDPAELTRNWYGRTVAVGGGWHVIFDMCAEMDRDAWHELRDLAGHRFTHVGELRRDDGSTFSGDEAFRVLDRVRLGLNLALGRRTTCALPVGWRGNQPVWCRWRAAPVDPYRRLDSHWLDETVVHQQIRDVVSLVLTFTTDEANRAALAPALAYYVAGNVDVDVDVDVELSVAIPLSALQLLAYYRFVAQRQDYSRTAWEKTMSTEKHLRLLLDDLKTDTSVPPHFAHLTSPIHGCDHRVVSLEPPSC